MSTHATHPTYSALSEDWSFSIEAKYASMRTLPDPFGIPGPSFMPSLSARTLPKFYPPDFGSHTMRVQTLQVGGWHPMRASQMAKNSPASPRVVRRGTARPAENRFAWPPWRPNTEILPQSAGSDNPESCFGAYRGTRTIAIPPCRRSFFFTTEHTESGFAGHRRRLGKDVVPTLQPQPCHRGGTRSVASARLPTYPFLTQKWYRPGARCTRAALGAGRPNAGGPQRVTTEGGDGRMDTGDNTKTHVNVDPINCVLPTNAPHTALPCVACGPGATAPGPHAIRRFRASRTGP